MAVLTKPRIANDIAPPAAGSVPGHNRPLPSDDAVREFDDLLAQRSGFADRMAALLAGADRAAAHDADTAGRCGELVKQITAAERVIEDARKGVKEPYLEAGRAVDAAAKVRTAPLATAKASVNGKLNAFMREEEERRRAEQRRREEAFRAEQQRIADERRAVEAARVANQPAQEPEAQPEPEPIVAAPPPPEPTRIRGDYGALASAKTVWRHEVADWTVAFMAVENNERVREAIDKAVGAMVRSGTRQIEGVRIFPETVAQVR